MARERGTHRSTLAEARVERDGVVGINLMARDKMELVEDFPQAKVSMVPNLSSIKQHLLREV